MATPEIPEAQVQPTQQNTPESVLVHEVQEDVEVTADVKDAGVSEIPSQFTQVVQDDSGKPMTVSPATQTITITLPATQAQLEEWAKGPDENAITWLAKFWLRMIKKAIQLGWNVVSAPFNGGQQANTGS